MDAIPQIHLGFPVWLLAPFLLQQFSFPFSQLLSVVPCDYERLVLTCPLEVDSKTSIGDRLDDLFRQCRWIFPIHPRFYQFLAWASKD